MDHKMKHVRERTLEELGDQVAAKNVYVGGGSAAAAAASLAAASAELVVSLSVRRSTPAEVATILREKEAQLIDLRSKLLASADDDEAALSELMRFYRSKDGEELEKLTAAARTSLEIGRLSSEIVAISSECVQYASRFTVSDLGTAAAIGEGAVTAALLTARINISLIRESETPPADLVSELVSEVAAIETRTSADAQRALQWTRRQIEPEEQDQA